MQPNDRRFPSPPSRGRGLKRACPFAKTPPPSEPFPLYDPPSGVRVLHAGRNSLRPPAARGARPDAERHFPACPWLISPPTGERPVPLASARGPRRNETVRERGRPGDTARAGRGREGPGPGAAARQQRGPRRYSGWCWWRWRGGGAGRSTPDSRSAGSFPSPQPSPLIPVYLLPQYPSSLPALFLPSHIFHQSPPPRRHTQEPLALQPPRHTHTRFFVPRKLCAPLHTDTLTWALFLVYLFSFPASCLGDS